MDKKFYLGLDIGTDSVGWAVTDENYNLIRKQGKHLWGARLFPEASDASTRRSNREARRRLQRRRWRIVLLQELFNDEMNKVDPNFFARLNNSALLESDKEEKARAPYLLFNDNGYTDKNFMKKYPTIYHLRQEMINNPDHQYDIREIYLVMAHMIKYRGNFLTDGEISNEGIENNTQNIVSAFTDLDNELRELLEDGEDFVPFGCTEDIAKKLLSVFEKETRSRYLADEILKAFGKSDFSTLQKNLIKLISGSKMQVGALYPRIKEEDEEISKTSLELDSDKLEEDLAKLAEALTDTEIAVINTCYSLYSFRVLINLLKGKHYISDAMVEVYNTHRKQLKTLKALVKRYNPSEFNHFFVKYLEKDGKGYRKNYVNYIGMTQKGRHKIRLPHSTNQEDLYKAIKSLLPFDKLNDETFPWQDDDKKKMQTILTELEAKTYLPRQNAKENGVFPYQLNKNEMNKIIDNQKKYYPFLGETSADYLNPNKQSYKLISLLEFKIPYFVGPLSNKMTKDDEDKESNFWMQRKQEGKITPWNFHDMIDEDKTAAGFIERMKNACTYIIGESTLPKCSLLYSEYMLLNEMNNWMINNQGLTKEVKEYLIENLYTKSPRTPTLKNIEECLKCYFKQSVDILTKTGKELKSEDIHANLKPFVDMADDRAFGPEFYKDQKKYDLAEEVIFTITMFEDKDLKKKKLESLKLAPVQIKYFMGLKYKDWGKLSKKLLNGLTTELVLTTTGETFNYTVIDLMRDFPLNLMEILETNDSEYTFREQISKLNQETMPGRESLIESSYASPAMKRAVRQTFKIIDELKQILHIDHFDTFFVECTRREDQKNVRKSSRKKQLQELLANIKLEDLADKDDLEKLLENKSEADLRRKKLFLYFMQMGRSVYTGEIIDINRLDKDYDIDHIIPQAKLKDDSFLNTVLVEKDVNNRKQDSYPLPSNVLTEKGKDWVKKLNKLKGKDKTFQLMPADKMNRILRPTTKPLEDEELVGFVNRQLTMTDQSVKAVCEILRETEKESKIVFSKASNVSEFRNVFGLTKCREINDFHHANDAYLNIVVGNVYDKVFTSRFTVKLFRDHFNDHRSWKIDVKNLFKRDEYAYNIINAGKCVWKAKHYQDDKKEIEDNTSTGTIDLVRKTLSWNDPMVTQMLFTQRPDQGFFNHISLHSAKIGDAKFPLKLKVPFNSEGWEKKYGGYSDLSAPYFMLVESDGKKDEKKYSLENIPSIFLVSMKTEEEKLKYLTEKYKLKNPKIILDKLLIRTVIEFPHDDGKVRVGISGKTGNRVTYVSLSQMAFSDKDMINYFKQISKVLGINNPAAKKIDESTLADKETIISNNITINKENNMIAFEYLQNNFLNKGCLKNIPGLGNKVVACSESKELFGTLSLINQMKTLIEIIKLGGHNTPSSDLTNFKLGLLNNTYLATTKELPRPFRIIRQSPTGFYEKVLFEK